MNQALLDNGRIGRVSELIQKILETSLFSQTIGKSIMIFKCRCMGNGNEHNGGTMLMAGEFHHHMSLVHCIYPYGLHRELYEVRDIEKWLLDDDNVRPFKYMVSTKVLRLCK